MNGLAYVDGFKICIQVCVLLGSPPWKPGQKSVELTRMIDTSIKYSTTVDPGLFRSTSPATALMLPLQIYF